MKIKHIDNSYVTLTAENSKDYNTIEHIKQILTLEKDNWRFNYMIRIGRESKYIFHYENIDDGIKFASGILEIPEIREYLNLPDLDNDLNPEIEQEIDDIIESCNLPYDVYDYQRYAAIKALSNEVKCSLMCTGSGKSLTISLILEYFRRKGLKGVLIVPNINLLTQFANDIKSYNLLDVHKGIVKGGGGNKVKGIKNLNDKTVLITTWQTLVNLDEDFLHSLDFVICDEVHRFSSKCTSQLVLDTKYAKYKLGFTGTLPDAKTAKLTLVGLFGVPENIVSSNDLIQAGRGTPIKIHAIKMIHTADDSVRVGRYMDYIDRVKFISNISKRTQLIAKLSKNLASQQKGSLLVLYTLIEHGELIYKEITGEEPSDLERQHQLGVYYMNGTTKAKDREAIRLAMDVNDTAILVANYSLLSTGVNIKTLRYAVFAAPLKSYTAIVQSLGRGIRVSSNKDVFEVYDMVDHFPGGIRTFVNSHNARKKIYENQKFEWDERKVHL